jgi:hypothetical protein
MSHKFLTKTWLDEYGLQLSCLCRQPSYRSQRCSLNRSLGTAHSVQVLGASFGVD